VTAGTASIRAARITYPKGPMPTTTAKVDVEVKPAVAVGKSTVAGGSVTLVAYALAIVAFAQGARDEATIGALVVGTLSLLTTLAGRYGQAIAAILATRSPSALGDTPAGATITNPNLDTLTGRLEQTSSGTHGKLKLVEEGGMERKADKSDANARHEARVMSKDVDDDDNDPGDDHELEAIADTDEELEHAPDEPEGGPPPEEVAPVPCHHEGLKDDDPKAGE
jgi:hypothetical protein